jgi:hypothetical protein
LNSILQIVPRFPEGIDGVADYALTIARRLLKTFQCRTTFVTPSKGFIREPGSTSPFVEGFNVIALEQLLNDPTLAFDGALLHYVNYGYQKRGVPFRFLEALRQFRKQRHAKFLTVFHELYASGPPWRSEFWLRPFQTHLAKATARLSDECIVSSENFVRELRRLVPAAHVHLHPVPSGLGEPSLSREQIENRDPHEWGIVGGTVLAERSLRSFCENLHRIPSSVIPQKLTVIGGHENPATRALLADLGIKSEYRPRIAAAEASSILRTCSFAWFNYFGRPNVQTSILLKSSAFAAACAHGVISVLPHRGAPISVDGENLPGPFFVESDVREVPSPQDRPKISGAIYDWYQRRASSDCLVSDLAKVFGLDGAKR